MMDSRFHGPPVVFVRVGLICLMSLLCGPASLFCGPASLFCGAAWGDETNRPNGLATDGPTIIDWDFESEDLPAQAIGELTVANSGPTNLQFVGLPLRNSALEFRKAGSYLRIADADDSGPLDFGLDDEITIEAWVRVDAPRIGSYAYIIGKGRTYEESVRENHNYALRLAGSGATAKISFLFSSIDTDGKPQYHRWTSKDGFGLDGSWHHVAVSYRFGDSQSLKGYVDAKRVSGTWDMGGATNNAPVVDNDSVWIGSSRGGEPGNSFVGAIDDLKVHRRIVPQATLIARRKVRPYIPHFPETASPSVVTVTLHESASSHTEFPVGDLKETYRFAVPKVAVHRLPLKYLAGGIRDRWRGPVLLRAYAKVELPPGELEILLRSPGRARVWIDQDIVLETPARRLFPDAHQPFEVYQPDMPWLRVPRVGDREKRSVLTSDGKPHLLVLEALVGSSDSRCELGETLVALRQGGAMFSLLGPAENVAEMPQPVHLVDAEFLPFKAKVESILDQHDRISLEEQSSLHDAEWERRHQLARRVLRDRHPNPSSSRGQSIDALMKDSLEDAIESSATTNVGDLKFLRRVSLDTIGVPPTLAEINDFLAISPKDRRVRAVERLLRDDRWADHWTSYWQDVLAENPNILKPKLNNSGPFRFWIHDALLLNKPMDRFVTELIRMQGSSHAGGPAGFGLATENDVPMAEKAHVLASAFLSVDMKCARCHDAPYHPWTQQDLFQIGAMLNRKPIKVPESSSVPVAFFDRKGRESPIEVTLQPGANVAAEWPECFEVEQFGPRELSTDLQGPKNDTREELAAIITRADNPRFARTMVNRVWTRMMGWGLMTSTDDWYDAESTNPELLDFLADEFVNSGYDLKHVAKLIMHSKAYQRPAVDESMVRGPARYAGPWQRRMSAEQLVDSMHTVTDVALATEPITFDPEASQRVANFLNLGVAEKAWELTSMANERDRPSLSLPKASAVVNCLEAFGWRASRHSPVTQRATEANLVQPGVVANGPVTTHVTRLTDDSHITQLAIESPTADAFIESLFLSVLTRPPTEAELAKFRSHLAPGFAKRIAPATSSVPEPPRSRGFVTWSNHFDISANKLMREIEQEVVAGPKPTVRLATDWRQRAEDAVWALLNAPEFQMIP